MTSDQTEVTSSGQSRATPDLSSRTTGQSDTTAKIDGLHGGVTSFRNTHEERQEIRDEARAKINEAISDDTATTSSPLLPAIPEIPHHAAPSTSENSRPSYSEFDSVPLRGASEAEAVKSRKKLELQPSTSVDSSIFSSAESEHGDEAIARIETDTLEVPGEQLEVPGEQLTRV